MKHFDNLETLFTSLVSILQLIILAALAFTSVVLVFSEPDPSLSQESWEMVFFVTKAVALVCAIACIKLYHRWSGHDTPRKK